MKHKRLLALSFCLQILLVTGPYFASADPSDTAEHCNKTNCSDTTAHFNKDYHVCKRYYAAIHLSNPMLLLSKAGVKGEFRITPHHSALVGYTRYWGLFPGWQANAEYRYYIGRLNRRYNFFGYARGGYGEAKFDPVFQSDHNFSFPLLALPRRTFPEFNYYFAGIGGGLHVNIKVFFLEAMLGIKGTLRNNTEDRYYYHGAPIFYITGPGALIDAHINFGFQF